MQAFLISLFLSLPILGANISEIRQKYAEAQDSAEITQKLYEALATTDDTNPVLMAYKGAVLTLKAKHSKSIKDKKTFFKEGVELLESAITNAPNNLEIHFIRLSVQENAPKIVRYNQNIPEDKKFILDHYGVSKKKDVQKLIKSYVTSSSLFSTKEKQLF